MTSNDVIAVSPYVWRLEAAAFITFKAKDAAPDEWVSPYQDYYFLLTVPHFVHERLRLELRPSYTRETTQLYYGLGNASVAPPDEIPGRDFYGRAHPTLSRMLRFRAKRALPDMADSCASRTKAPSSSTRY